MSLFSKIKSKIEYINCYSIYSKISKMDPDTLPRLSEDSFTTLLDAFILKQGLVSHHLDSFNELMTTKNGINQIITEAFTIEGSVENQNKGKGENDDINTISFEIKFTSVSFGNPTIPDDTKGTPMLLYPHMARKKHLTYSAPMHVTAVIKAVAHLTNGNTRERVATAVDYPIASIPIMVRSDLCNTRKMGATALMQVNEDPKDPGGYFIIRGREYAINTLESILYNSFHVHKNSHKDEIARGIFISKPGDAFENSIEIIVRYHVTNGITLELRTRDFDEITIPFYVIYRLFGMVSDKDIIETIIYDHKDPLDLTKKMINMITNAIQFAPADQFEDIRHNRNPQEVAQYISSMISRISVKKSDNHAQYGANLVLSIFDANFLPHVGTTPEDRISKLHFFGHLIRRLLFVRMEIIDGTDKDSYRNKRLHPSGFVYAKGLKKDFNAAIIKLIRQRFITTFKNAPSFDRVELLSVFRTSIKQPELERAIVQSIQTGKKTISVGQQNISNRIVSQDIQRKNQLNFLSFLRLVSTSGQAVANQTARATDMRAVHPSYVGNICVSHSAETGEKIGKVKQLALTAMISSSSYSSVLINILEKDPNIVKLKDLTELNVISRKHMNKVFVNGKWIGVTEVNSHRLADKYRQKRRVEEIHRYTTIYVDIMTQDLMFWVDIGRVIRPLLVVQAADPNDLKSTQDLVLTQEDVDGIRTGRMTIQDLEKKGAVDYISAEEQENCLIAQSYKQLWENRNNPLLRFTHCEIQQAIFGLAALVAPMGNHTQAQRITMLTNHARQTCGWPALNYPYRYDKGLLVQNYCDMPLARTIANNHIYPIGQNLIVAFMSAGFNQEDSAIVNKATIDHGKLTASYYTYEMTVKEKDEIITTPRSVDTYETKAASAYEKITNNGRPVPGTIINKDDVVIGKVLRLNKEYGKYSYVDKSLVYRGNQPAVVSEVIESSDADGADFIKVILRSYRPVNQGDKMSSRSGNKSIVGLIQQSSDMPFTDSGLVPDIILNPHAIPTRMIIGQLIESVLSKLCAIKGTTMDATSFSTINLDEVAEELKKYGVHPHGYDYMTNGKTGERIKTMIFICPSYYQRLQKFVIDEMYAVTAGSTDSITRQPLRGKNVGGSFRNGEMEKDTICSHGAMFTLREKFNNNSDGYDLYFCRNCGKQAIYNSVNNLYRCRLCEDMVNLVKIPSSWMTNIINHEISGANIDMRYTMDPLKFEKQK